MIGPDPTPRRDGKFEIQFEGVTFVVHPPYHRGWADQPRPTGERLIEPGDLYLARRNTGWELLTCKIHRKEPLPGERFGWWITPVEVAYAYNTHECWKVVEMKEEA